MYEKSDQSGNARVHESPLERAEAWLNSSVPTVHVGSALSRIAHLFDRATTPSSPFPICPPFRPPALQEPSNVSHIVQIQTEVRDPAAVQAACDRHKLPPAKQGTTQLFSGSATGLAVQLPGWQYPVVCDVATGQLHFDNFGGRWGDQRELDRFLQTYAVEKARIE